jgi:biopolymer transport protein ExbB/TolQ
VFDSLVQAFSGPGAAFMYAITAVLAFGLAVGLERLFVLMLKLRTDEAGVLGKAAAGDLDGAQADAGAHPVAQLIAAGAGADGGDAAWDRMASEAALIERDVRQRVPYLATVGNISTMLGLLGTVYGLILAFTGLGDASAVERAQKLSEGIATAMSTTAFGLLVGIPALALHAFLEGRANRILRFCEAVAGRVAAARRAG